MSWICLWYSLLSVWMPLHHDTTLAFLQKRPVPTRDTWKWQLSKSPRFSQVLFVPSWKSWQQWRYGGEFAYRVNSGWTLFIPTDCRWGLSFQGKCTFLVVDKDFVWGIWWHDRTNRSTVMFFRVWLFHIPFSYSTLALPMKAASVGWQESDYPFVEMPFDGILGKPGALPQPQVVKLMLQGHWECYRVTGSSKKQPFCIQSSCVFHLWNAAGF